MLGLFPEGVAVREGGLNKGFFMAKEKRFHKIHRLGSISFNTGLKFMVSIFSPIIHIGKRYVKKSMASHHGMASSVKIV